MLGVSLINHHTIIGPKAVSSKKNKPTCDAEINLGAKVIKINDIPTVKIIKEIKDKSDKLITKLPTINDEIIAVNNLPITYEGMKFLLLEDLITTRLLATEMAAKIPKKSPNNLPDPIES